MNRLATEVLKVARELLAGSAEQEFERLMRPFLKGDLV